jgi:WD40 repeat protein
MFKVWDVRTFTPVQTFNCPLNEINCFAVTTPPKRIVAGGRKLIFYDYDEPTDNHLADDQACLSVLYNPVFYTFITAHPKCIKTWDATTGALQSVFRDLTQKEITSICLDERKRKLFVGDSRGRMFSINIKNGAKMKKFKKGEKSKNKDKDDISGMYYWGGKQCGLLAASWDGNVRLYDDSDSSEEGIKKYTMDKHKDSVNHLDFRLADDLCASCGDDGYIYVFNFQSYRQECSLKFQNQDMLPLAPVKIVKFLEGTDILVAADLDGFIHFYCVTATQHPRKNSHLCKVQDHSIADIGDLSKPPHFPIRAMDFDKEEGMLYTGDEMGYLIKWDINILIDKLAAITPKAAGDDEDLAAAQALNPQKLVKGKSAFITDMENGEKIDFLDSDIQKVLRYRAHQDLINEVTFVPECGNGIIATCSFDCNVYMWSKTHKNKGDDDNPRLVFEKVGSLVLGTGAASSGE